MHSVKNLTGVDKVLVGEPGVINVVNCRGKQRSHDLQWREDRLQSGRVEQVVHGQHDVRRVDVVVICHVAVVVRFQGQQKRHQLLVGDLEQIIYCYGKRDLFLYFK